MYNDKQNVCYYPEEFGLSEVGSAYLAESNWDFYILKVFRGDEGFYMATDSGCSCPSPFESYGGIEDLTGPLTAEQVTDEARALVVDASCREDVEEIIAAL